MTRASTVLTSALLAAASLMAAQAIPPDLAAMAETERQFARAATVEGWRDAFLEFFADDAIAFTPQVARAKDRLRKQPAVPFSELELLWEPRTGDVAASGELGWLTGPSTMTNHKAAGKPRYGCYLSVWRKQTDGRWRVFIDIGADAPAPVTFDPGFTRIPFGSRYTKGGGKEEASKLLSVTDRDLNAQVAARGFAAAYAEHLTPASRLHRTGSVPTIGRAQIARWFEENATTGTTTASVAESAASADFGYTYGNLEVKGPKPSAGIYVRLWSRDEAGRWWLMVDVAQVFT